MGRHRSEYCGAGLHLLTDENVYISSNKRGAFRKCRICTLERVSARARSRNAKPYALDSPLPSIMEASEWTLT